MATPNYNINENIKKLLEEVAKKNGVTYNHELDCCENVFLEDITGDLNDLVGVPLLLAEERSEDGKCEYGTCLWTFYEFRTVKGSVTVRWFGESNGYYSESVDFRKEEK